MKKVEIGKTTDYQKFNSWFAYCSKNQIPYVIVRQSSKYASVEWDYINLDPKFDRIFDINGEESYLKLLHAFKKYGNIKSEYTLSNKTFFAEKIFIKDALNLAEEVYDIVNTQIS